MSFKQDLSCFSFMCSAQPVGLTKLLKHSNKILLPPSILHTLTENQDLDDVMFFKVNNKEMQYGIACGIQEFSSPPGICHVPYYIMEYIGIKEGGQVEIEKICPVQGSYIKLRPHKTAFINLPDPKAILESVMSSDYPVVSQGQTIEIFYNEKKYLIDILETQPDEVISIINTDINIDFEAPLDYVEPPTPPQHNLTRAKEIESMSTLKHFVPFTGHGHRLGEGE